MTYVETSVILAQLLAEDRCPPESLWADPPRFQPLDRIRGMEPDQARGLGNSHGESVRLLLGRLRWLEMTPLVLARALDLWPIPVRTLDALHLASVEFLRAHGQSVKLASYDEHVISAGRGLSIPLFTL
jgi:hypothetical protein